MTSEAIGSYVNSHGEKIIVKTTGQKGREEGSIHGVQQHVEAEAQGEELQSVGAELSSTDLPVAWSE